MNGKGILLKDLKRGVFYIDRLSLNKVLVDFKTVTYGRELRLEWFATGYVGNEIKTYKIMNYQLEELSNTEH
jgi:hypothetical protein